MTRYCAFLRAVNLGGASTLPMAELRDLCVMAGFAEVSTFLASGNVLLSSEMDASSVQQTLHAELANRLGKDIPVFVRTQSDLRALLVADPFAEVAGNRLGLLFLSSTPAPAALEARGLQREEIVPLGREVFIHYPDGMGRSKLRFRALDEGTVRNRNTVEKLVGLLGD